jgi:hypothetical protein
MNLEKKQERRKNSVVWDTPNQSSGALDLFARKNCRSATLAWRTGGTPVVGRTGFLERAAEWIEAPSPLAQFGGTPDHRVQRLTQSSTVISTTT